MTESRSRARLLPRGALIATSEVDHADWNYRRFLGALQRRRFELLLSLIGERRHERLLEVGYGSGVLMPELAARCRELVGVDLHPRHREVRGALADHGVHAELVRGSVAALPFADARFDCVLTVSALEYVDDVRAACAELKRVLTPDGVLLVVTPGHSPLLDLGLRLATGESAAANYGSRRQRLLPALREQFRTCDERVFPPLAGRLLPVYRALRLAVA